ncbi:MAG: hypothetical protein A2252_04600 [Elusimicrobia bacterium RIFOXYA2_FULL_39_19]|nr:MAG: hypothetical protein A2252_04600 [Elusimicrobia bacterium RIFOXYA2_FULL_39_19]
MKKHKLIAVLLLAVMFGRLVHTAWQKSATYDEAFYVTYGYTLLKTGDYRISIDKPPLVPAISAFPLLIIKPKFDTSDELWLKSVLWRSVANPWGELGSYRWALSLNFLYKNTVPADKMLFYSRLAVITAVVLLGFLLFFYSEKLFGPMAALYFTFFYSFCPNILGNAFLTTEDTVVSALIALSIITFLLLIEKPSYKSAVIAGLFAGLALLSKHTALFLFPIYACALMAALLTKKIRLIKSDFKKYLPVLGILLFVIAFTIAAGYKFSEFPLYFINIKNTLLYQSHGQAAFCWGKYSTTGFWYYYLVCLLFKTPVTVIVLFIISPFIFFRKKSSKEKILNVVVLYTAVVLLVGFASVNKIQLGFRYILPAYAIILLLCAVVAQKYKVFSFILCAWLVIISAKQHPDYLAYFNELALGKGYNYLVDSNIDWGQDLKSLKEIIKEEKPSDVILSYYGAGSSEETGFVFEDLYSFGLWGDKSRINSAKPKKELLAISATNLQGLYLGSIGHDVFYWLKDKEPVKTAGGSIFVYDITKDVSAYERLAHIYFFTGQLDKALNADVKALALNEQSAMARLLLSFMYIGRNDRQALIEFENAVKLDPQLSFLYNNYITCQAAQYSYYVHFSNMRELCKRNNRQPLANLAYVWMLKLAMK